MRRKASTSKSANTPADLQLQREVFSRQTVGMIQAHKIPSELVINWDQTGINLLPASDWALKEKGCSRVEIASCEGCSRVEIASCGDSAKSQLLLVYPWLATSFQCSFSLKVRQRGLTLTISSQLGLTFGTPITIGLIMSALFVSSRT